MKLALISVVVVSLLYEPSEAAWGSSGEKKVILKDIDVLTLYHGKMTKGQRSSPVPQLECLGGGTAPCSAFTPKVVQCMNKGSDGYDVQWECKTDMDNAFRFGEIDVSCEGFDYPDDPYVLHGSCGLRYSLDYTKEGLNQNQGHDYYGGGHSKSYNSNSQYKKSSMSSMFADLVVYAGVALMLYAFYTTCLGGSRRHDGQTAYSSTNDDYPAGGGGGGGYGWFGGGANPPPPHHDNRYNDNASCHNRTGNAGGGGGGFWTGAATGGLLGYMFGNSGNRQAGWGGRGYGGGWGGGGGGWGGGSSGFGGGASHSSGTRSASGFGGTSRR